jgi:hypothetical protein
MLLFFVLGAAVYASVVPPVDLPETAYDEADTPVGLALPAQATVQVVCPPDDPITMWGLPRCPADCVVRSSALEPAAMLGRRHRHSLQYLLCSFLI